MLDLYGQRLENALMALFPEIGLDASKFNTSMSHFEIVFVLFYFFG